MPKLSNVHRPVTEKGQGFVEYAIILFLVGIAVVLILQILEPTIGNVFSEFVGNAPVAPPALIGYTPPPTVTNTPSPGPSHTPSHTPSSTPTNTPGGPTETPTPTDTSSPTPSHTPSPTTCPLAAVVPGRVETENYRCGGQGSAYSDNDPTNNGGQYRADGVDIENTTDAGGGYNIGWTENGEWLRYEILVSSTTLYDVQVRVSSPYTTGRFRLLVDGVDISGQRIVPNTGGNQSWLTLTIPNIGLPAGSHSLELRIEGSSANYNYIQFGPPATPTPSPTASNTPVPTSTPTASSTPTPTNTPLASATPTPSATPGGAVLFVVGSLSLNNSDDDIRNRIVAKGYTVTLADDNVVTSADATGKILVVVSASVNSAQVNTKFRLVTVPVLVLENALMDDMDMTSSQGTDNNESQIAITNSAHPMAAGLTAGLQTVVSSNETFTYGVPRFTATTVATIDDNSSRATIYGYATGAVMFNSLAAPARRVGFFLDQDTAESLNTTGWSLFDAALNWAITGS
jgi:hypothetical protein